MANQGFFDKDSGRNKAMFDPIMQKNGFFDPQFEEQPAVIFYADRPKGTRRPFPFLPSTAQRRMN